MILIITIQTILATDKKNKLLTEKSGAFLLYSNVFYFTEFIRNLLRLPSSSKSLFLRDFP